MECDLFVIGSGPGGQKAAIQAAKLGKRVVVAESGTHLGGACVNSGTIPSKCIREAIIDLMGLFKRGYLANWDPRVKVEALSERVVGVVVEERHAIADQFNRNNVTVIYGKAHFVDQNTIKVGEEIFTFEKAVIASGSRPRNPDGIPFSHPRVMDSTLLLEINEIPKSLIVMGGGIIGSEYATFFAALGTEVKVVDKGDHILPLLDREIGNHLQESFSDSGLQFHGGKEFDSVATNDKEVYVSFKDGSTLSAEFFLFALGREANVSGLGIDNIGLGLDKRGYLPVNALFQTACSHIYAVGDVIGPPALASTSMEQGRLAALHAFGEKTHHFPTIFPIGIYTIPEISSVGYTEEQLKAMGFKYEVGRAFYYELACSQISGHGEGMFKILFHADTLQILGIQIIGRAATEVIHIGQVAMTYHATIEYFINHVFNYPTYAEGYRIAALNGYNKVGHRG